MKIVMVRGEATWKLRVSVMAEKAGLSGKLLRNVDIWMSSACDTKRSSFLPLGLAGN